MLPATANIPESISPTGIYGITGADIGKNKRRNEKMQWEINTKEDYENAMKNLNDRQFIADMSDDFRCWRSETAQVELERADVKRQAREKGIIS
jgi:hypothetical protein